MNLDKPIPKAKVAEISRALPQSPEAEMAILTSLVTSPATVHAACTEMDVAAGHFANHLNGSVFECLSAMISKGTPLDFITLKTAFADREILVAPDFITQLFIYSASSQYIGEYLRILCEKRALREAYRICHEALEVIYMDPSDPEGILGGIHGEITKLLHKKSTRPSVRETLREILKDAIEGQSEEGLFISGFKLLDDRLRLYRGDLLIVSAPTSFGKSALSMQIAFTAAIDGKHRIALYPLEMFQKQTLKRAIAQMGGNNADFVRKLLLEANTDGAKAYADKLGGEFSSAAGKIAGASVHIRDDLTRFEAIRADLRAEHAKRPIDFVVIDYLQLIQVDGKHDRRQREIAYITQNLKLLAKELNAVICVPSQVNKEGGTREAEDAENDASALIKIHAEKSENGDSHPGRVEIWKQREGARHMDLPLAFNGMFVRFEYAEPSAPVEKKPFKKR